MLVKQVPPELWGDIFLICVSVDIGSREPSAFDYLQPMRISHVCSFWRAVSLDLPAMWCYIRLKRSRIARLFLERSRDLGLHILAYLESTDPPRGKVCGEEGVLLLAECSPRITALHLRMACPLSAEFVVTQIHPENCQWSLPMLKDLRIDSNPAISRIGKYRTRRPHITDAQSLRRIIILSAAVDFNDPIFLAPGLTTLSIIDCDGVTPTGYPIRRLDRVEWSCVTINRVAETLVILELDIRAHGFYHTRFGGQSALPLPRLKTLRIIDTPNGPKSILSIFLASFQTAASVRLEGLYCDYGELAKYMVNFTAFARVKRVEMHVGANKDMVLLGYSDLSPTILAQALVHLVCRIDHFAPVVDAHDMRRMDALWSLFDPKTVTSVTLSTRSIDAVTWKSWKAFVETPNAIRRLSVVLPSPRGSPYDVIAALMLPGAEVVSHPVVGQDRHGEQGVPATPCPSLESLSLLSHSDEWDAVSCWTSDSIEILARCLEYRSAHHHRLSNLSIDCPRGIMEPYESRLRQTVEELISVDRESEAAAFTLFDAPS